MEGQYRIPATTGGLSVPLSLVLNPILLECSIDGIFKVILMSIFRTKHALISIFWEGAWEIAYLRNCNLGKYLTSNVHNTYPLFLQ